MVIPLLVLKAGRETYGALSIGNSLLPRRSFAPWHGHLAHESFAPVA
jgi:hypothetical protein